jgi:inorganic pyrophosphatase
MITVFIEVAAGSNEKHAYDEQTLEERGSSHTLRPYPYPYGFVPGTVTDDGEALDCYLLTRRHLAPGTQVECEPAGLLEFFEEDEEDHKLLALLPGEQVEIDAALRDELAEFIYAIFRKYPGMRVRVGEIRGQAEALALLKKLRSHREPLQ